MSKYCSFFFVFSFSWDEKGKGKGKGERYWIGLVCERVTSELKGHGCVNRSRVPFQIFSGFGHLFLKGI